MRRTFYRKQLTDIPNFPGRHFKRTLWEGDRIFLIEINRVPDTPNFDIDFKIAKRITPTSGPRIVEHCLTDKAIDCLPDAIKERITSSIEYFWHWHED
jgi:hypothetical protein